MISSKRKCAKDKNEKYYKTGLTCRHGHIANRLTSTGQCTECLSIRNRKRWSDDDIRISIIETFKKYKTKDYVSKYNKEYYLKNKDAISLRNKSYHNKYSESESFLEKKRITTSKWIRSNRERSNWHKRARRITLRTKGKVTASIIEKILYNQKYLCNNAQCNCDLTINKYHVDHIMPVALGGDNSFNNLQCLCAKCNLKKSKKHPDVWKYEIGCI